MYQIKSGIHGPTDISPVGMAAALHLDIAIHNFGIQEYMKHSDDTASVFRTSYTFEGGLLHPGEHPGLGVEYDEELGATFQYTAAYLPVNRSSSTAQCTTGKRARPAIIETCLFPPGPNGPSRPQLLRENPIIAVLRAKDAGDYDAVVDVLQAAGCTRSNSRSAHRGHSSTCQRSSLMPEMISKSGSARSPRSRMRSARSTRAPSTWSLPSSTWTSSPLR